MGITGNASNQDGVIWNANQTDGGKWVYTRTKKATTNASAILNLSSQDFTLWTKVNSGFGNVKGDIKVRPVKGDKQGKAFTYGEVTADNGFVKYTGGSFAENEAGQIIRVKEGDGIRWSTAQGANLLTHTVATNILANVLPPYSKAMNKHDLALTEGGKVGPVPVFRSYSGQWNSIDQKITGPADPDNPGFGIGGKPTGGNNGLIYRRQIYSGKNAAITDTRTVDGSLIAKIAIAGDDANRTTARLDSWLARAVIKNGQEFKPM